MGFTYNNKTLKNIYQRLPITLREWFAFIYSKKVQRKRFGGVFSAQLEELKQDERMSLEERKANQLERLKAMLTYAGNHTPYYHELFADIGFDPHEVHSAEDIRVIPPLEKNTIRIQYQQLLGEGFKGPTITHHTSGTTGLPLEFILSEEAHQRHYACLWFHFSWVGFHRGDRIATFGGHPVAATKTSRPTYWLYDRNENDLMFSSYDLSPQTVSAYVKALSKFKPKIIRGYPSMIYLIALHLLDTNNNEISPKGIFTYAETTLDHQRGTIEKAFGCPVYSSYGNGEHVGHLLQCLEGNFHEITESAVIEVLTKTGKPAKSGEEGELIITSLINKAMPMIRYRVGDSAVQAEDMCSCGRKSPILKDVAGRTEDLIITPDGKHLRRMDITVYQATPNIKEAQFIQEKIDQLTVKLVTRSDFDNDDEKLLMDALRPYLGEEMDIKLHIVEEIPRTSQGKYRFVISKVPTQF